MCNAISKSLAIAACALALASCGGNDDKDKAEALLAEVEQQLAAGNPDQALALMDSLDSAYPAEIETRRKLLALRPQAMEATLMQQMQAADSIRAFAQVELDQIAPLMRHVPGNAPIDGHYVVGNASKGDIMGKTTFEPRVDDDNLLFFIVANNAGRPIGISRVQLTSDAGACESQAINPALVLVVEGKEAARFSPESVADLGQWAAEQPTITGGAIIASDGKQINVKFSKAEAEAFATAWRFAALSRTVKDATALYLKLNNQLQVARDQGANHNGL